MPDMDIGNVADVEIQSSGSGHRRRSRGDHGQLYIDLHEAREKWHDMLRTQCDS